MKSINEYLVTEPHIPTDNGERTDEVVGLILASALAAYACAPLFQTVGKGLGGFFSMLGNFFGSSRNSSNDGESGSSSGSGSSRNSSNDGGSADSAAYNKLLALVKKTNDNEKDETKKKETEAKLKLLTACSFDENGNEVPFEKRMEKMKDALPAGTDFEAFKKDMEEQYNKIKDDPKFKEQLAAAAKSIKDSDVETFVNNAKKEARETWAQVAEDKKKQEELDKEIADLEAKLNRASDEDKEKIQNQIDDKKSLKDRITGAFGGIVATLGLKGTNGEPADPQAPPAKPANGGEGENDSKIPKETQEKLDKEKADLLQARQDIVKEQEKLENDVKDLEAELEKADDDKKEEIQKKIDQKNKDLNGIDSRINAISELEQKADADAKALSDAYEKGDQDAIKKAEDDYANNSKSRSEEANKHKSPAGGKGEPEPKPAPKPAKKPEDYSNDDIDALQNELSDLDPEKDKDKIKEKEELLKSISKAKGKDENELIPQTDKTKDGKAVQKKVGPRGGKYYRVKGDNGWGEWTSYSDPSQLPESLSTSQQILQGEYMPLRDYIRILTEGFKK